MVNMLVWCADGPGMGDFEWARNLSGKRGKVPSQHTTILEDWDWEGWSGKLMCSRAQELCTAQGRG